MRLDYTIRYIADNINVEYLQYEYRYKIIKPYDQYRAAMYYRQIGILKHCRCY